MEIHKPKPWHNTREFLKEYLIIVVGVLTALGAEAVVERVHEHRLSVEARESVRAELNTDLTNLGRRLQTEDCISRRLDAITTLLDTAERGEPFAPAVGVGGPGSHSVATQRWQAATAGGRTSLLTSDEQADFARAYNMLNRVRELEEVELGPWSRLQVVAGSRHLSQGMVDALRLAVSEARTDDRQIQSTYRQAQFYADRIGIKGDAKLVLAPTTTPDATKAPICQPMTAETP